MYNCNWYSKILNHENEWNWGDIAYVLITTHFFVVIIGFFNISVFHMIHKWYESHSIYDNIRLAHLSVYYLFCVLSDPLLHFIVSLRIFLSFYLIFISSHYIMNNTFPTTKMIFHKNRSHTRWINTRTHKTKIWIKNTCWNGTDYHTDSNQTLHFTEIIIVRFVVNYRPPCFFFVHKSHGNY